MKRPFLLSTSLGIALISITAAAAPRFGSPEFEMNWSTMDGGGGVSAGDGYELFGTIGQPDVGGMSGGDFELTGGFWGFAEPEPVNTCPADIMPQPSGDGQVTIADISNVLSAFGLPCSNCPQDIMPQPDGNNQVTIADITAVLTAFGLCPP